MFAPNDAVRFDNTGASNLTVNLVGDLNAASVVVDSASNYVFSGSGGIVGACSLTKTNSGTLTINNANNTYTGKTTVAGGMLVVSGTGPGRLSQPHWQPARRLDESGFVRQRHVAHHRRILHGPRHDVELRHQLAGCSTRPLTK